MADTKVVRVGCENRELPGFLRLPLELRQRIYRECLVEPARWYRQHTPTCPATRNSKTFERPAFATHSLISSSHSDCKCTRRRGIQLLRVSRLIHREAAHMFWTENVFCFVSPAAFRCEFFFDHVQPAHRLLIRHVQVLPHNAEASISDGDEGLFDYPGEDLEDEKLVDFNLTHMEAIWESIFACKGLRTLEVHFGLLMDQLEPYVSRLRCNLPDLQTLRIAALLPYTVFPAQEEVDRLADLRRSKNPFYKPVHNIRYGSEGSGYDSDSDSDSESDSDSDSDSDNGFMSALGTDVAAALPGSAIPNHHMSQASSPGPPPPPPVRNVVLRPVVPAQRGENAELSRTLWFKVGVTVDNAVIDEFTRGTTLTSPLFPRPLDDDDSYVHEEEDDDNVTSAFSQGATRYTSEQEAARHAFRELLRSFRTNFIVHMRHAIEKLPYEWAEQCGQMPPLPLRELDWTSPKRVIKKHAYRRRHLVDLDSSDSCDSQLEVVERGVVRHGRKRQQKSVRTFRTLPDFYRNDYDRRHDGSVDPLADPYGPLTWYPEYGLQRYHPDAVRDIATRVPLAPRWADNETAAVIRPTLRDGTTPTVEIFGLPPSAQLHRQRVRVRRGYAARHEATPEQREQVAQERAAAKMKRIEAREKAKEAAEAEVKVKLAKRQKRRGRLAAAAAKQTTAARRARFSSEILLEARRRLLRKRLPGRALDLMKDQYRRMTERAARDKQQQQLEDEAEKKMQRLAEAKLTRKAKDKKKKAEEKKKCRRTKFPVIRGIYVDNGDASGDDESDDDDDESDDDFWLDSEFGNEPESSGEEPRWPVQPKWTKPVRTVHEKRYGGHAYRKSGGKRAVALRLTADDLDTSVGSTIYE